MFPGSGEGQPSWALATWRERRALAGSRSAAGLVPRCAPWQEGRPVTCSLSCQLVCLAQLRDPGVRALGQRGARACVPPSFPPALPSSEPEPLFPAHGAPGSSATW